MCPGHVQHGSRGEADIPIRLILLNKHDWDIRLTAGTMLYMPRAHTHHLLTGQFDGFLIQNVFVDRSLLSMERVLLWRTFCHPSLRVYFLHLPIKIVFFT